MTPVRAADENRSDQILTKGKKNLPAYPIWAMRKEFSSCIGG
jgi:hypothetical protein